MSGKETKVHIDREHFLPPDVAGGVEVMTRDGKIKVVSTLESRLELLNSQVRRFFLWTWSGFDWMILADDS